MPKKKKVKKITTPKSIEETKKPILADRPMGDGYGGEPLEPESEVITQVTCIGCKGIYPSDAMQWCNCQGTPAFCPNCAKPGTCHQCGKKI